MFWDSDTRCFGHRPSELLNTYSEHVFVPISLTENIIIRLGAIVSTKAKREQFVVVSPDKHKHSYILLRILLTATTTGQRTFPYSYWEYRSALKNIDESSGLGLGITPHSPRAGFASEAAAANADLEETRKAGRWSSEANFRIYIDVIGALHVASAVRLQGLEAAVAFCSLHLFVYLSQETWAAEVHG